MEAAAEPGAFFLEESVKAEDKEEYRSRKGVVGEKEKGLENVVNASGSSNG